MSRLTPEAQAALDRHKAEVSRAVEMLAAIPPPPKCCSCDCVIEVWWSYCAMCGWHLASGEKPR